MTERPRSRTIVTSFVSGGGTGTPNPARLAMWLGFTVLLYGGFYGVRGSELSRPVEATYVLGFLWLTSSPMLVWYYEERLLTRFLARAEDVLPGEEGPSMAEDVRRRFRRAVVILVPPVFLLLGSNFVAALPFYEDVGGIYGVGDPFFWMWGVVWVLYFTIVGAIGLAMVHTNSFAARRTLAASEEELGEGERRRELLPLLGATTAGTMLLFASCALLLPKGLLILAHLPSDRLVYAALFTYLAGFVASGLLPLAHVARLEFTVSGSEGLAGAFRRMLTCPNALRMLSSVALVATSLAGTFYLLHLR